MSLMSALEKELLGHTAGTAESETVQRNASSVSGIIKAPGGFMKRRSATEFHTIRWVLVRADGKGDLDVTHSMSNKVRQGGDNSKSKGLTNIQWYGSMYQRICQAAGLKFTPRNLSKLRVSVLFDAKGQFCGVYPDAEDVDSDLEIDIGLPDVDSNAVVEVPPLPAT